MVFLLPRNAAQGAVFVHHPSLPTLTGTARRRFPQTPDCGRSLPDFAYLIQSASDHRKNKKIYNEALVVTSQPRVCYIMSLRTRKIRKYSIIHPIPGIEHVAWFCLYCNVSCNTTYRVYCHFRCIVYVAYMF